MSTELKQQDRIPHNELIRVKAFDYIRQAIIDDIIDGDSSWFEKDEYLNKTEFERGAFAAIALITHRIDCILD